MPKENEFAVLGGGGVYLVAAAKPRGWRQTVSVVGGGLTSRVAASVSWDGNVVGGGGLASKM